MLKARSLPKTIYFEVAQSFQFSSVLRTTETNEKCMKVRAR